MGNVKLNGPVAAILIVLLLIVIAWLGNRAMSPPQTLGPAAQQMKDAMQRAHPEQFK